MEEWVQTAAVFSVLEKRADSRTGPDSTDIHFWYHSRILSTPKDLRNHAEATQ